MGKPRPVLDDDQEAAVEPTNCGPATGVGRGSTHTGSAASSGRRAPGAGTEYPAALADRHVGHRVWHEYATLLSNVKTEPTQLQDDGVVAVLARDFRRCQELLTVRLVREEKQQQLIRRSGLDGPIAVS